MWVRSGSGDADTPEWPPSKRPDSSYPRAGLGVSVPLRGCRRSLVVGMCVQAHPQWAPSSQNRSSAAAPKTHGCCCCPVCSKVQDAVLAGQNQPLPPGGRLISTAAPEGEPGPRGAQQGWGACPSQDCPNRPPLLRGPRRRPAARRSFPGAGDSGTGLTGPRRAGCGLSGSPPALVTPVPAAPTSYTSASRGERRGQRAPGCPARAGFQRQPQTLPSRRLRLQTHPSQSDSNNSQVRPPGRNDTPSPSRPPKRRTNPLILHENTRVTDDTV